MFTAGVPLCLAGLNPRKPGVSNIIFLWRAISIPYAVCKTRSYLLVVRLAEPRKDVLIALKSKSCWIFSAFELYLPATAPIIPFFVRILRWREPVTSEF